MRIRISDPARGIAMATALVAAAGGLGSTALAQSAAATDTQALASPNPTADADMSTAAAVRPKDGREAKLGGITAGSIVQTPAGEAIGRVKDIVPDSNTGNPAYVVIATRSATTAVPYSIVAPMYQSGHVVLDKARLESAPRVRDSELADKQESGWKKQSEQYWQSRDSTRLR